MAKFQKGQSGNPNGRPPKNRALTDLLEAAGNVKIKKGGKNIARKNIVASLSWELLTTGEAVLPNNEKLKLSPQDWVGLYKWIYTHIDGPAKSEIDLSNTDGTLKPDEMKPSEIAERVAALLKNVKHD